MQLRISGYLEVFLKILNFIEVKPCAQFFSLNKHNKYNRDVLENCISKLYQQLDVLTSCISKPRTYMRRLMYVQFTSLSTGKGTLFRLPFSLKHI